MQLPTLLSDAIGIRLPIIQAPMAGGATTPELVAAVSNAGALGSIGAGYLSADALRAAIRKTRLLTDKPFSVNLFIPEKYTVTSSALIDSADAITTACADLGVTIDPNQMILLPSFKDQLDVVVEEKVPVFSFTFGLLELAEIQKLKAMDITLIGTATNVSEALMLEQSGIDFVVVQGCEAGGHRGTFLENAEASLTPLNQLITECSAVLKIPIISAGGIMDGGDIVKQFSLGSCAVQMGTAFLTCHESGINQYYKDSLIKAGEDKTTLTRVFSGKLARGIDNKFIQRMRSDKAPILDYPIQNALTKTMREKAKQLGCVDYMSMWAGQGVAKSYRATTAQLIQVLIDDIKAI